MTGAEGSRGVDTYSVPEAPYRPGDKPSFDAWDFAPEDLSRPDPKTCTAKETVEPLKD